MPAPFTGSEIWRETIVGPAPADPVTAASVADMGVLLADRSLWQKLGTIGYVDECVIGIGDSGSPVTVASLIKTNRFTLTSPFSVLLVIQSLPLTTTEDGWADVEPVLFDATDTIIDRASKIRITTDTTLQQLIIVAGYESVEPGDYSFGVEVTREVALAKFDSVGSVRTIAVALPRLA